MQEVNLAGRAICGNQHVCAFFSSKEEEYRVLMPFLREGLEQGQRVFNVVDSRTRDQHRARLHEACGTAAHAEGDGQLAVLPWEEAYLRDGRFDIDSMVSLCHQVFRENRERGYPLTRLWANMEWGLEDVPGVHDIVAYESRLNKEMASFEGVVGVCTYDLSKFSAATVMDIMRTHPMVIVAGILQENPFYTPHEQFMEELRQRN